MPLNSHSFFPVNLGSRFRHSSRVCPHIKEGQRGAYVDAVEEMVCVVCVDVTEGEQW